MSMEYGSKTYLVSNMRGIWHDDVIKWKHFPRYWPLVRGIHRSPVNSPHKGQWRGALMFTLICARINGWVNNLEAGDLRRYRLHYDVIVVIVVSYIVFPHFPSKSTRVPGFFSDLIGCATQSIWVTLRDMLQASKTFSHWNYLFVVNKVLSRKKQDIDPEGFMVIIAALQESRNEWNTSVNNET